MPPKRGAPEAGANGARAGKPAQGRELRARGRRTLQRLLDAGVTVFARRGYHAARVDDIVKVARTSHGTFYLYFSNKEDLFRTLAENVAGEMRELAESMPTMTAGDDGYDALRVWLERFADVYEHYGPVIRAWTEAEIGGSEFGRMGTDVLAEFTRVLVGRISKACPPDVDPAVTAIALVAMIERFNYYVISRQVKVTRDQMLDTLTRAVHDSLFGARTIEPA
jgi:AcrR family transcriptional regulator